MADPAKKKTQTSSGEASQTFAELSQMLALRRELAEAEIRHDVSLTKSCAVVGLAGFVATITGLAVAVTAAASYADTLIASVAFPWITVFTGTVLLIAGGASMLLARMRFRRRFLGLQETISELREDGVWLREWFAGNSEQAA